MKQKVYMLIYLFLFFSYNLYATKEKKEIKNKIVDIPTYVTDAKAYAIMEQLAKQNQAYYDSIGSYNAEIYINGSTKTLKKNFLFKFLPKTLPYERKQKETQFQMLSSVSYYAPRFFEQKIHAYNGDSKINKAKLKEIIQIVSGNLLTSTYFKEEIILPISKNAFKYYFFQIKETNIINGEIYVTIKFKPRYNNSKLINGEIIVNTDTQKMEKATMEGYVGHASVEATFYLDKKAQLIGLPTKSEVTYEYSFLGNKFRNKYYSYFQYDSILSINEAEIKNIKNLDLSNSFYIEGDTIPIISDSLFWIQTSLKFHQPIPTKNHENKKKFIPDPQKEENLIRKTLDVSSYLFKTYRFNDENSYFRYSGFLNPLLFRYSKKDGVSYRQKLRFKKEFNNKTSFSFTPELGYLFKREELFYKIRGDWTFEPLKMGYIGFELGNNNRIYSSAILEEINKQVKKSKQKLNFKDLNLHYYDDDYLKLYGQYELINGLLIKPSLTYHHRKPSKRKKQPNVPNNIEDFAIKKFIDVVPGIGISYTPKQYYAINDEEKRYVRSAFPTFSLEWARGIPKVLNASGNYERIEIDIEQTLHLNLLKKFSYHFSAGSFIKHKSTYFANFKYFQKKYFPTSWDDEIGGSFQLLDQNWFNASSYYYQAHLMYESPFLLLPYIKSTSRFVLKERFYFGTMSSKALPRYSEIGYGIGNQYFDIGAFSGFMKGKFKEFGIKISFGGI